MSGTVHAVVNPRSAGGRTGRDWPQIEAGLRDRLGPVSAAFTRHPLHAAALTADALRAGADLVLAVGGDGTLNECVNGFFKAGRPIRPSAELGLVTSGTGGDFRRTLGVDAGPRAALDRLAAAGPKRIDLGRLRFIGDTGREHERYFINIASFGLSGAVDRAVNSARFARRFGGRFAFAWCTFRTLLAYRGAPVRLSVDDTFDATVVPATVAVCNGRFFGGGMQVAPDADPADGRFHVVVMNDVGPWSALRDAGRIYTGDHVRLPSVRVLTGRRVTASPLAPSEPVLLDVDGEAPGRLPLECEVLPDALTFRC